MKGKTFEIGWFSSYLQDISSRLGSNDTHLRKLMESGIMEHLLHPRANLPGLTLDDLHHMLDIPGVISIDFASDFYGHLSECCFGVVDPIVDEIDEAQLRSRHRGYKSFEIELGSTFSRQITVDEVHGRIDDVDKNWKLFKLRHLIEYGRRFPHTYSTRAIVSGQKFNIGGKEYIFCLTELGKQSQLKAVPADTLWSRNMTLFPRYRAMP